MPEEDVDTNVEQEIENEDVFKEASKSTVEAMTEMQEKKAKQVAEKKEKPKKKDYDLTKLNTFKSKLIKDFGLEEKTNERKRTALKHNGKTVIRFIPRKRVWYAVKHKDDDLKRMQYYTVESDKDEQEHYNYVKQFVEAHPIEKAE